MPSYWSPKDERQYKHIVKSCHARDKRRSVSTCKRIAAATVNKHRGLGMVGGKAHGMRPSAFNAKQLKRGTDVEMEHTNKRAIAKQIAMDHLLEDPKYYVKLSKVHLDGLTLGAPKFHVEFRSSRTDRWHSMCETYQDKRDAKQWARESKAHAVEVGNPPGRYRVVEGPSWECLGRRASVPVVAALLGALGITYYLSQKA
jgi:hypothetical protein